MKYNFKQNQKLLYKTWYADNTCTDCSMIQSAIPDTVKSEGCSK